MSTPETSSSSRGHLALKPGEIATVFTNIVIDGRVQRHVIAVKLHIGDESDDLIVEPSWPTKVVQDYVRDFGSGGPISCAPIIKGGELLLEVPLRTGKMASASVGFVTSWAISPAPSA